MVSMQTWSLYLMEVAGQMVEDRQYAQFLIFLLLKHDCWFFCSNMLINYLGYIVIVVVSKRMDGVLSSL